MKGITSKQRGQAVIDRVAYRLASEYLLSFKASGVTRRVLHRHIEPDDTILKVRSMAAAFRRLLETAQGRNMSPGVIGKAVGGVARLGQVLFDFNPRKVAEKYDGRAAELLDDIVRRLQPVGKLRRGARSLWPQFCKTIVSGAVFLGQFRSVDDLYGWIDSLYANVRARPALPLLFSLEIKGFGFALACDFLKEIGYRHFGKPDVHVKAIFKGLELVAQDAKDYEVYKAMVRVAQNNGVSEYNVDKLFWLVGSGRFYLDGSVGTAGRITTDRQGFIQRAHAAMYGGRAS